MSRHQYIIGPNGEPKPEPDLMAWGLWMETGERFVKREEIGPSQVSTVFLGLDHNFSAEGPPILWETMVFGGPLDQSMDRCSGTREQAEAMHNEMCERVRKERV